ncbi:TolC family protein [Phenylobacterium sp.]|uniref:TolC family protein n=1 Tax=Phenylobacterium sp. TaxID=1871053 RepID=UPI002E35E7BA|nr:TolC family protein [Phenylobacterium sp.]HEX3365315.1 TolC family protein [Phenylobacterium sp.]
MAARTLTQKPPGQVWSGADLLTAALTNNPQIAEARAKYLTALAGVRAAKAPPGPSLTLTAEYATEQPRWGYTAASNIPLDYGARRSTRIDTAELQALQAYYDLGETIWSVRTDLEKARIDADAARAEIILATVSVGMRADRAQRLERRVEAGQDARTLAITANADLTAARRRLAAASGRRDAAVAALAKALGVSVAAARDLPLAPMEEAAPSLADLPSWRRDAAVSRRDVLRAVADYDIAEQALRLQVAIQYPAISISPTYFYDHGVQKYPFDVGLALPPWDLNRNAIRQAEATRAAAGRSLELAQANVLAAVDIAGAAFATAWDDLKRNREQDVPLAGAAAAAALRSQQAGATDKVDTLAAQAAAVDAGLAVNDAQHAAASASADLEDALRRSFDPAETAVIGKAMTEQPAPRAGGAR